ncbi:MAG: iron-sulfur cluster repair di-iron protein [Bacteroidetes bacterium]|nr:iron-sulfur cluster repair di-iron protein [Bacteroidota bacterium]
MDSITGQSIVGELVAQDYRTASVFQSYGIDFCFKGDKTIDEVCSNKNIEAEILLDQLQQSVQQTDNKTTEYNSWPLDLLAEYIEKKHHRYVTNSIEEIKPFLNKLVRVHGDNHPELIEVENLFAQSAGELSMHMKKEELILFPFIRKMVKAKISGEKIPPPHFGTIKNPIAVMNQDHDGEGERFERIANLTHNYTPPTDGCNTYRVTLSMLKEFEEDLHLHIHLENNILFPKSIKLEPEVLN